VVKKFTVLAFFQVVLVKGKITSCKQVCISGPGCVSGSASDPETMTLWIRNLNSNPGFGTIKTGLALPTKNYTIWSFSSLSQKRLTFLFI
jgi:hypothetical protein